MKEPKSAWLAAFDEQMTSQLLKRCRRYAQWCLRYYRLHRGESYADEVVQDALIDVLARQLPWDPAAADLYDRVCNVVRYRIRNEKVGRRERHESARLELGELEELALAGGARVVSRALDIIAEREYMTPLDPLDPADELARKQGSMLGAQIGEELAKLVDKDDDDVRAVLMCLRAGIDDRAEVCAETGMSPAAFHNARRRLGRLQARLPEELRALALEFVDGENGDGDN